MRTYQFVVGSAEAGLRLDRCLTRHLPATLSRAMIQRGIREGRITVGDRPAKVHQKLRSGDVISACVDQLGARARHLDVAPQAIPLDIVYEDSDLLVVNKPAGLVTHPAPGHWDGTLVNAILWHLRHQAAQGSGLRAGGSCPEPRPPSPEPPLTRAGIVHRLDKDTSGLLLVAKTPQAHASLSKQLKARTIRRRYLALLEGHLPLDAGTVNIPLGRHLTHRKEMTIRHLGGRSAVTHYRVLRRFDGSRLEALGSRERPLPRALSLEPRAFSCTLIEASLETGRTHQIRVHMAHLGHPIVGDATYGKRPTGFWRSVGVNRHFLHARRLQFQHPMSGQALSVVAPVPDDMAFWCGRDALDRIAGA